MLKTKKKKEASVLVVTIIIMGIILLATLTGALITLMERRSSLGEYKSSQALQSSQSGLEMILAEMKKSANKYVTDLNGKAGMVCDPATKFLKNATIGYQVELMKANGASFQKIDCDDASAFVSDIAKIKSVGGGSEGRRAVEATPICYEPDISFGLVGHWKFDSNGDYADYSTSANSAQVCTAGPGGNYTSGINPVPNITNTPSFLTEGGRSFIRFNDPGNNCAMIPDIAAYHLQEGSVSFWVRYRDTIVPGNVRAIFKKDANACDTRTDINQVQSNPPDNTCAALTGNNAICDCGHLGFGFGYPIANNLSFRFQNDGNGTHYILANDTGKIPMANWSNVWHLVTLTFDAEKYVMYVDGEIHSTFEKSDPPEPDGNLEAMLGNDWRLWLGAIYPDGGQPNFFTRTDMDDFRLYDHVLNQCEINYLYQRT